MQNQTFYSNGKLLLTGEYVVLDGAKALAVPTRFGQNLIVKKGNNKQINWISFDSDESIWFQDNIAFSDIKNKHLSESDHSVKNTLIEILHQAFIQNPDFFKRRRFRNRNAFNFSENLGFRHFFNLDKQHWTMVTN